MFPDNFSFGEVLEKAMTKTPNFKFRDRDKLTHYASGTKTCGRQLSYKNLGIEPSNPTDMFGLFNMRLGSWIERGLQYELFGKMTPFGVIYLGTQNDTGEHGTFYGTSWHGYRDGDFLYKDKNSYVPFIAELKAKVGYGAACMVKDKPWSTKFSRKDPDTDWGNAQQLALYLRDAYLKTSKSKEFKRPIKDGVLLYFLFRNEPGGRVAALLEYFAEYIPENDTVKYYQVKCQQIPELNGEIDLVIDLPTIARNWKKQDEFIAKDQLAPPDYSYRWDVNNENIHNETKTSLTAAIKGDMILGDVHCKYCSYKDRCSEDLGLNKEYSRDEISHLKNILSKKK